MNKSSSSTCQFRQVVKDFLGQEEVLSCHHASDQQGDYCLLHCDKANFTAQQMMAFEKALTKRLTPVAVDENYRPWGSGKIKQRLDFTGVLFPKDFSLPQFLRENNCDHEGPTLLLDCRFANFPDDLVFTAFQWQGSIDFRQSSIGGTAYFRESSIGGVAYFRESSIGGDADFSESSIGGAASFSESSIGGYAYFRESSIGGDVNFRESSIGGYADFSESSIGGDANFSESSIGGYAYFRESSIGGDANFSESSIGGTAYFRESSIGGSADFGQAVMTKSLILSQLICTRTLNLSHIQCGFLEASGLNVKALTVRHPKSSLRIEHSAILQLQADCSDSGALRLVGCQPNFRLNDAQKTSLSKQKTYLAKLSPLLVTHQQSIAEQTKEDKRMVIELPADIQQVVTSISAEDKPLAQIRRILRPLKKNKVSSKIFENVLQHLAKRQEQLRLFLDNEAKSPAEKEGEFSPLWDFKDQRCDNLAFVECDMRYADFSSSDISGVYFDACQWSQEDKPVRYCHLMGHQQKIKNFKKAAKTGNKSAQESARIALEKQQNTYQRFKKFFEENHDYALAGQFHFREMQLRELLDTRVNRGVLKGYQALAHYGENYLRAFGCWLGLTLGYPAVVALSICGSSDSLKLWTSFKTLLVYYFSAIFPRALNNALGLYDGLDLAKPSNLQHALTQLSLHTSNAGWLVGSMVLYYVAFILLSTLFIMALRRSFRRR